MDFESEIRSISLDGFQLVNCKYFSRSSEPIMTLFSSAVSFNAASKEALNCCESVEILINEKSKSIIVRPAVNSKHSEAIKWKKPSGKAQYSRIECSMFSRKIYSAWGLDKEYSYKTMGKLLQCDKKVNRLFHFSNKEAWQGSKMIRENC